MSITLSDGSTTVTLHPDLFWSDEDAWAPVQQTVERTLTGAQVVSVATKTGGRPITLGPLDESSAWMTLALVTQLRNWAAVPGQTLTLTLRGVARTVLFRHQDGAVLDTSPVVFYNDTDSADYFRCTLRLMEV